MTDAERVQAAIDELVPVEKHWPASDEDMAISRALAILRGNLTEQDKLGQLIDANQWRLRIPQRGIRTDIPSPEPTEC